MSNAVNSFGSWTTFPDPNNNIHNVHQVFVVPTRPGPTIAVCGGHGVTAASAIEVQKRAALIAAAPDLLEAAKMVLAWHDAETDPSGTTFWERVEMCRESEDALRAAIAKATGVEQ